MLSALVPTIYVQLSPEQLTVRNAKIGESISEIPEIAVTREPKARILAVGSEARSHEPSSAVQILNPFAHPRTLVGDSTLGEQLLKAFIGRLQGRAIFAISPKVVMHPLGDPAGGYTQVEARALHEMAIGAGASSVVVWQGRGLSDQEVLSGQFPADGKVLT
jgi:rod shape-determining protein MreB